MLWHLFDDAFQISSWTNRRVPPGHRAKCMVVKESSCVLPASPEKTYNFISKCLSDEWIIDFIIFVKLASLMAGLSMLAFGKSFRKTSLAALAFTIPPLAVSLIPARHAAAPHATHFRYPLMRCHEAAAALPLPLSGPSPCRQALRITTPRFLQEILAAADASIIDD